MARMVYDIKVPDNNPAKAKVNRLLYDGNIPEMITMIMYPISKMYDTVFKEWGVSGVDAFKKMLDHGLSIVYQETKDEYLKAQDQGGT